MGALITDEFSHLQISRQRKYQLRMKRDHKCEQCGQPAEPGKTRCAKHLKEQKVQAGLVQTTQQ